MKVVVGLSGGVDSAVSALLLKNAGHDVTGVFMKNWDDSEDELCPAEQDWKDVKDVCNRLDIPYYSVNFTREYYDRVFKLFLDEYKKGRTPNPDVLCNKEIKFKAFLEFADKIGAEKIATGHFVRTNDNGELLKGFDSNKDQSYFLYMLKAGQLKKAVFPVGEMTKQEVRQIAEKFNLLISAKKDSTGVCFIGERNFKKFLQGYIPAKPGNIVTIEGDIVGKHDGLMFYTLGQRKGLGIGGYGDGRSLFVVQKDIKNNNLIVAQGEDSERLYSKRARLSDITWINGAPKESDVKLMVKTRYRQPDQEAVLRLYENNSGFLDFTKPQRAITPGQSAVFYIGDRCLGGGIIEEGLN